MDSASELIDIGLKCLVERLGAVDAERFISLIIREQSDYTKWRQRYFEDITSDDFHHAAMQYGKDHKI